MTDHRSNTNEILRLPRDYRSNPIASADRDGNPYWENASQNDVRYQVPVYRMAAKLAKPKRVRTVVDIGCGSGDKLNKYFQGKFPRVIGVDQGSAIALAERSFEGVEWLEGDLESDNFWEDLAALEPDLTICADVIEHLADPTLLLQRLRRLSHSGVLILSTPDRDELGSDPLGPPGNPRHVREWTMAELRQLVENLGFVVVSHQSLLPREYSPTLVEAKRLVWRVLHRQRVPDRRSCQVLVLRPGLG